MVEQKNNGQYGGGRRFIWGTLTGGRVEAQRASAVDRTQLEERQSRI